MKRFWTNAAAVPGAGGWGIELDGKPLRTPARAPLTVPVERLAQAIAAEWNEAPAIADPQAMPLTGLAYAAIDRAAPDPAAFTAQLARYGQSDLLCYRADGPSGLVARQSEAWDPLLAWARRRFDVDFETTSGIVHVAQPAATIGRLAHAVAALDPFQLAGLAPLVSIGGSLVAALALLEGAVSSEAAWQAVSLDERWQLDQWGSDSEAEARLDQRHGDFLAAARFLKLLDN